MRCKEGDLAVIVKEFSGCEKNLGVVVKLIGPVQFVAAIEHPMWPVVPLSGAKLLAINNDGSGPPEAMDTSKCGHVLHPDQWLMPLKDQKASEAESKDLEVGPTNGQDAGCMDRCLELT